MISLLEVAERSQKAPKLAEDAWNMGIFEKRYDIKKPADCLFFNEDHASAPHRRA